MMNTKGMLWWVKPLVMLIDIVFRLTACLFRLATFKIIDEYICKSLTLLICCAYLQLRMCWLLVFLQHLDNYASNVLAQYSYVLNTSVHIGIIAVVWTSLSLNVCEIKFTDRRTNKQQCNINRVFIKNVIESWQQHFNYLPILAEYSIMFIHMKNMQVSKC